MKQTKFNLFVSIITSSFLGLPFDYKGRTFHLQPTILSPYDFLKRIRVPKTEIEKLLSELDPDFKATARSEMYRKGSGWIARGIEQRIIKRIEIEKQSFIVPVLSPPAVGIDTSGLKDSVVIVVCCFDNFEGGYAFLERHLNLPKARAPVEFKWNKLGSEKREKCSDKLIWLLNISCKGLLVIETNLLISPVGPRIKAFVNLIEGCFSGFETMPTQPKEVREGLRQKFFLLCNDIPIHCDTDFRPLEPDHIVRSVVRTLSRIKGKIQTCDPLHAPLRSQESQPIQITDIVAGVISKKIRDLKKPPELLKHLYFDNRKIPKRARKRGKFAKAYYWLRSE